MCIRDRNGTNRPTTRGEPAYHTGASGPPAGTSRPTNRCQAASPGGPLGRAERRACFLFIGLCSRRRGRIAAYVICSSVPEQRAEWQQNRLLWSRIRSRPGELRTYVRSYFGSSRLCGSHSGASSLRQAAILHPWSLRDIATYVYRQDQTRPGITRPDPTRLSQFRPSHARPKLSLPFRFEAIRTIFHLHMRLPAKICIRRRLPANTRFNFWPT